MLPAPLLAAKLAGTAKIVPIATPATPRHEPPLHPDRGAGLVHPLPGYDMPLPRLR